MWRGMERRDFLGVGPQRPAEFAQEGDEGQASRWDSNKGEEVAMGQRLSVEALLPVGMACVGRRCPRVPKSVWLGWWVPTGVQMAGRNSGEHRRQKQGSEIWVFPQVPLAAT